MSRMIYLGYFAESGHNTENRLSILASANKMAYIAGVFNTGRNHCEILSASYTLDEIPHKAIRTTALNGVEIQFLDTLRYGGRIRRIISRAYSKNLLKKYLLTHLKKDDILIVYHSLSYLKLIQAVKQKIKCTILMEVEELYSDVAKTHRNVKIESLVPSVADAFFFPTVMLNDVVNPYDKPYAIIHGTYQVEEQRMHKNEYRRIHGWDEHKIHVVYAGTFDPRKGGALAAADAAAYLPENYHIHILGFGLEADVRNMQEHIANLAKRCSCQITYDGLLSGEDYIQLIQSCDIGLSTQNPDAAFNSTSFPSKILSYMANGLRVVSVRIPVVEESAIARYMYFYDKQTPEEIAKAITAVKMTDDNDARSAIVELDAKFRMDAQNLIAQIQRT